MSNKNELPQYHHKKLNNSRLICPNFVNTFVTLMNEMPMFKDFETRLYFFNKIINILYFNMDSAYRATLFMNFLFLCAYFHSVSPGTPLKLLVLGNELSENSVSEFWNCIPVLIINIAKVSMYYLLGPVFNFKIHMKLSFCENATVGFWLKLK